MLKRLFFISFLGLSVSISAATATPQIPLSDFLKLQKALEPYMQEKCGKAGNFCSPIWWEYATEADIEKELKKHDINQIDPQGKTPLITALEAKVDIKIIKFLLEKGADVNKQGSYFRSPLEASLLSDNVELIKLLLAYGAKVKPNILVQNEHVAQKPAILNLLLQKGARIDARDSEHGDTLLLKVVHYADVETIQRLVKLGANVNAQNSYGDTVLMNAATHDNPQVIQYLLEHGAKQTINNQNEFSGNSALITACISHPKNAKLLLQAGANPNLQNHPYEETALMQAIDKPNLLRLLLKFGANPNLINNYGENALAQAYQQAKTEKDAKHLHKYRQTIEILKPITNMNERDKEGRTALQKAYFKPDKMLNLIELGCDVNIHNKEGRTPLMSATYPVQIASLKLLLEHGADPNLRGSQNKTALMIQFSNPEAVELLIEHGAQVNLQDKFGNTALSLAVGFNKIESVTVLLKHGANPNLANHKGFTPLMKASINGYAELVELLMKNGAAKSLNAKNDKGKTALDVAKDASIRALLKKSPN